MTSASAVSLEMGSVEHRHLLARFFLDTHVDYTPEAIKWPALGEPGRSRLAKLPFWQEAVSKENETSHTVAAAVALEPDPELRKAIELQGFEESRHARLLEALTRHYRIRIETPAPFQPQSLENDFLFAGFGECFDSFFAFGLFAIARDSGYFAPELVAIFEPVMQEEARHILFFVNWVKYRRCQLPWWRRPGFRLRCGLAMVRQVFTRIKTARAMAGGNDASDTNFTLNGHKELGAGLSLRRLLELCLAENHRRMAGYDSRLARPRLVPRVARLAYRLLPAGI